MRTILKAVQITSQINMKNKIIVGTVLAIAIATLLTGCISINIERAAPNNSGSVTNTVTTDLHASDPRLVSTAGSMTNVVLRPVAK